jgi:hypothetical protein
MSKCVNVVVLVLLFAGPVGLAFAQGGATGAISGTVQDPSEGAVPRAKVEITNEETREVVRNLTTDTSGLFTAPLLPVGSYSVQVSAAGFATTKFPGVLVRERECLPITMRNALDLGYNVIHHGKASPQGFEATIHRCRSLRTPCREFRSSPQNNIWSVLSDRSAA